MLRRVAIAALVAIAATACSEPPDKERQQAEGALAAARAAEAATYAADDLNAAQAALDKYDGAVRDHDYRLALSLAVEARDGAYRAAKEASDGKAAARSQTEGLVADLGRLVASANARLAGSGPRLTPAGADRVRQAVKTAPSTLQEARSRMGEQDYLGAIGILKPVVTDLRAEIGPVSSSNGRRTK